MRTETYDPHKAARQIETYVSDLTHCHVFLEDEPCSCGQTFDGAMAADEAFVLETGADRG